MPTLSELRVRASYDQRDFKAALEQSKNDMREAGRVIKTEADAAETAVKAANSKIGSSYAALPQAARKAFDEALTAQRSYQAQVAQGMTQVGVALSVGITAPFALFARDSLRLASSFEQTMDVLQASIQGTQRDMAALRAEATALGADITLPATSAVDAANAMNQLAKGGLAVADVLKAARGTMQLAAAAGVDAAQAATIQARALSAFQLEGAQATRVADLLAKSTYSATGTIQDMAAAMQMASAVMHSSGQSIDDTVAALTLMAKAGLVGSDAGTSLKSMFMRLQEGNSIPKVRDLMRGYGIEVYDASGKMKDMRGIIEAFAPMMENLTEKQRNAALAIIFGSDAVRSANVVLGGGVKAFDAMTDTLGQQGAAADLAAARNKGLAGALDGLKSAWETLAQQSADGLLRPLADLTRTVAGLVGVLSQMDPTARGVVLTFGALLAAAGPLLVIAGQLKTAWITLFGVRAAATAAAATAAAAETALAVAETAQGRAAAEAAVAEAALASAQSASTATATAGVAAKGAAAAANQALAVSAGAAATATATASTATVAAAGSTGLLASAMAALVSPVGLVVLGITALAAAGYALHQWATEEERQAQANAKAFQEEYKQAYEGAKAKAEAARKSKALLSEYMDLERQTNRTNEEQRKYKQLANDISLLIPELVAKYDSQGQAILDVAAAHKEAARQAQNHYDKEAQLAKSRLNILDSMSATDRAASIRAQMSSPAMAGFPATQYTSAQSLLATARDVAKTQPQALGLILGQQGPLSDALTSYGQAYSLGKNTALLEAKVLRLFAELQNELRKAEADAARLKREADDLRKQATMSPAEWGKYQADRQKKENEAQWRKEAEDAKRNRSYQAEKDAWFKANGYEGIDTLAPAGRTGAGSGAGSAKRNNGPTADSVSTEILLGIGRGLRSPSADSACAWFASSVIGRFTKGLTDEGGRIEWGAASLVARVGRAIGSNLTTDDAVRKYLYQGMRGSGVVGARDAVPGALAFRPGTGASRVHVGVYLGDGRVMDMNGQAGHNQFGISSASKWRGFMNMPGAGKGGPGMSAAELDAAEMSRKFLEDLRKAEEEAQRLRAEIDQGFARTHSAIAAATDGQTKYAEMLGLTLQRYKQLAPEEKARAERLFGMRSTGTVNAELARMKAAAGIEGIQNPTDRALAQFAYQTNQRTDITDADKARLIEQKRGELAADRAAQLDKEVLRLNQEKQLLEAISEEERIRLRLMMARPDLKPDELNRLAKAELDKYQTEQAKGVDGELSGKGSALEAAKAQLQHDQAMQDIAKNMALTEAERYKLIQDQNDALRVQLYTLEQMARVQKGEITAEQANQLVNAERLQVSAERASKDLLEQTKRIEGAQEAADRARAERMDKMQQDATDQAGRLADIIMRPFQDGLGKGLKGFWNSMVDGWRQTVKQMFMDWMRSQLMKSLDPLFEGRALRQYKAEQSAKAAAQDQARAELLKGSNIAPGETAGVPNGANIWGRMDPMGAMASIAMLFGNRKRSLVGDILGIGGLLTSTGAFGKGGWLSGLRFAAGGNMPYGQPALVGEFGPEIWTPPSSGGRIHNAGDTQRMLQSSPTVNVTQIITTPDPNSFRRSSRQIASEASAELGRSMRRNFVGR